MTELHPVFDDLRCVLRTTSHRGIVGGYYYLTDAAIIVRQPCSGHDDEDGEFIGVCLTSLPWDETLVGNPYTLPDVGLPSTRECESCYGTGQLTECERCSGYGFLCCDMGHDHECPDCDEGWVSIDEDENQPCDDCLGKGAVLDRKPFEVSGVPFDICYLWALSRNKARIYPAKEGSHIHAWDIPGAEIEGFIVTLRI